MRMVGAWSAHVLRMVGGMGRAALYLKVSPTGLWPAARSRPVAGFLFKGCRPVPPTPGFSCGFRATKNTALGFGFFGLLRMMRSDDYHQGRTPNLNDTNGI